MSGESCTAWRERMQAWLRGQGQPGDREAITAHRAGCEACEDYYRDTAELLAQMRQGETRRIEESPRKDKPRRRRNLLIALAVPIFALLMWNTLVQRKPVREEGLRAQGSGVELDKVQLSPGEWINPREGATLRLEAGARAELRLPSATLELEGPARCTLERLKPLRVRVLEGRVRARGEAHLVSNLAELMLAGGEAQLELVEGQTRVRGIESGVQLTDKQGTRLLLAGQELRVE